MRPAVIVFWNHSRIIVNWKKVRRGKGVVRGCIKDILLAIKRLVEVKRHESGSKICIFE